VKNLGGEFGGAEIQGPGGFRAAEDVVTLVGLLIWLTAPRRGPDRRAWGGGRRKRTAGDSHRGN